MSKILLISGPNLEMLGEREPEVYGASRLEDLVKLASDTASSLGCELEHFSSNSEGDIVSQIADARGKYDAIIINPGALTHYAWSLHDALAAFEGPIVELHISNPESRESWRKTSVVAPVANGVISGFKDHGYQMAVEAVFKLLEQQVD